MLSASVLILVFLLAFCIPLTASKMCLKENGYENLLIAINPQVPENVQIINNIKNMVTDASLFLFNATKRRFYYRDVKILIPLTWQSHNYRRPKHEVYEKANVIINKPNFNHGNDPYTLQYEGCGKEGRYIHFTPDFLIEDSLLSVYGPRGKVFVHEWAHLRWGVFDEYNYGVPFYVSVENKIKSTRCSSEISGMYICKETSCLDGECMIDPQTGSLAEGCMFLVNSTQSQKTTASIMYMPALSSVVDFCDKNTHDQESPNMQNQMCSYRSTWEVIMDSADYVSTLPMANDVYPPPPNFSLLQTRRRVICLVLDVSSNMATGDRIHRLHQAAALFILHFVEVGSHLAIVTYNDTAEIRSPLRQIDHDDVRRNLTSNLPNTASGESYICKGVLSGLQLLKTLDGNGDGNEIILVSGGRDENLDKCFSQVLLSGSVIHTIAIGPNADSELECLSEMTGGSAFFASGNMVSDSLIGAFTEISTSNGDHTHKFAKLFLASNVIRAEDQLTGSVYIDGSVGINTLFIITWQASALPDVIIEDPTGNIYNSENLETDTYSQVAYFILPETSQVGEWKYTIINTLNSSQVFDILVTSRPAPNSIPLVIHLFTNTNTVTFPNPMVIFAEIKQGYSAILGVNVTAVIESEFGNLIIITLTDDGTGADAVKDDGIYSRYVFSFMHNGRYTLKIHAQSNNNASSIRHSNSHTMYVPGYIDNDTIRMNPLRSIFSGEIETLPEIFIRTIFSESFKVKNISQDSVVDLFPPCTIVDLEAKLENDYVILSWTAPGDNYDQGIASSYEIRMSTNPFNLREHFDTAIPINTSSLMPKTAGSKEHFSFLLHSEEKDNGSISYFGIRTRDNSSLMSDISNLAQLTRHTRLETINYSHSMAAVKIKTSTVIYILVSFVSLCLVIEAGLYSFKRYSISKLQYHAITNDLRVSCNSTEQMQTRREGKEHELPLYDMVDRVYCEDSFVEEENTEV
ncbi:calcium-activated chloride channel regulator 2-like [Pelobates fuscus]|uniref:calcium-activated chloride channel regulator 2-like n=1 Tax=Pelobates fuscus TaxID=191477 RepID=UPI002FE42D06